MKTICMKKKLPLILLQHKCTLSTKGNSKRLRNNDDCFLLFVKHINKNKKYNH